MKEPRSRKQYCEKVFKFGYDRRVIRKINEDHINTLPYGY